MTVVNWTHPSVRTLLDESEAEEPYAAIEDRARALTLEALEHGWEGPPYDPFYLADVLEIQTVARQDLEDARLVPVEGGKPRIEFNPNRRPARVRFSLAHELGHYLLSDHAEQVRYRNLAHEEPRPRDYWQLESICNVAAAELLMPAGAFPLAETADLSLPHLLDLRKTFGVSTEALLRRVVKLTDQPACLFAAARTSDEEGFRIDYTVGSRSWPGGPGAGDRIPADSVLSHCTAVGFSDDDDERWGDTYLHVQAVGIPPYPGDRFPRVVGLLLPAAAVDAPSVGLRYVRGTNELDWPEIEERSGLTGLADKELTSKTKKLRRVGEFEWDLLRRTALINAPTDIALTFADYIDRKNAEAWRFEQLTEETIQFIEEVERVTGAHVSLISTGFMQYRGVIDRRTW